MAFIKCQYTNDYLLTPIKRKISEKPYKSRLSRDAVTIQTHKFEINSIQFCIGVSVLFGFIFVQLS